MKKIKKIEMKDIVGKKNDNLGRAMGRVFLFLANKINELIEAHNKQDKA